MEYTENMENITTANEEIMEFIIEAGVENNDLNVKIVETLMNLVDDPELYMEWSDLLLTEKNEWNTRTLRDMEDDVVRLATE